MTTTEFNLINEFKIKREQLQSASIFPSKVPTIDRFLARSDELYDAFREVEKQLETHEHGLSTFADVVLHSATFFTSDHFKERRTRRNELIETNVSIVKRALQLSALLKRRAELHEVSGHTSGTHYCILNAIDAASIGNAHYRFFVKDKLDLLRGQFDSKYWPSISDVVDEIALDASSVSVEPTDNITYVGTSSQRASKADAVRALFENIDQHKPRHLPDSFSLSDRSWATIISVAFDIEIDAQYLKNFRQREREMNLDSDDSDET